MKAILITAHCFCGHVAELSRRAPCPACGASTHDRITPERMGPLRAVAAGRYAMAPNRREWLVAHGLIVLGPPRPPRLNPGRRPPMTRPLALTERGRVALAAGDALQAAEAAEARAS